MKLDNRGFAISTFMYMLLILAMILILATLAIFSSRKMILDKQKNVAMENSLASSKKICKAVSGVKSLELGTEYECKVNNTDTFNFYVLSLDGTKVNLIMDRNICEDGTTDYSGDNNYCRYAWYISEYNNSKGPGTAMEKLYNATKEWTNIPDMSMDIEKKKYYDEGNRYGYIKTTNKGIYILEKNGTFNSNSIPTIAYISGDVLKARLPKKSESLANGVNCTTEEGSCESWIVSNLRYFNVSNDKYFINSENIQGTSTYNIGGYWTLSSSSGYTTKALAVNCLGKIVDVDANYNAFIGIRPVITVSKSNLYS